MKIASQSANEIVLKEGSIQGMIVGMMCMIAGVCISYFLRQSNPYMIYIGLGVVALGIGVLLFSSSITVVANKTTGQLFYEKKRLVGAKSSTYAIDDVFRIETRRQWQVQNQTQPNSDQSVPQQVLVAQSVIVFKNGQELALDHQKQSSNTNVGGVVLMGGQGGEVAMAAQVAKFLGVPFQEISPPNMGMGINIIT
jgi:Tfp pilus assembly PilM family ATPase